MWAIEVNNTQLEFDGTIPIILNNPIFSDEISYSLQFTVKNTIVNRKAFGYINMPEIADNKSRELPCVIKADPLNFSGTIVVSYQSGAFACYFKQNGDFWSAIKDKSIKDIPFDKIIFDPEKSYLEMIDFIHEYQENTEYDFTFPLILNNKATEKFSIIITSSNQVNNPLYPATTNYPIIPFLYVRTVYESIFQKYGISINKNAFFNSFLRKLVMPNNYMINTFEIDATVASQVIYFITHITNEETPVVTTVEAHNIVDHSFIKIGVKGSEIPSPIHDRIFQIELVDATSFKILNENFSSYAEYIRKIFVANHSPWKVEYYGFQWVEITVDNPEDFVDGMSCYMRSDDWSGVVTLVSKIPDVGYGNFRILGVYEGDLDYAIHTYPNLRLIEYKGNDYQYTDGTIQVLSGISESFKEIDLTNHLADITIKDFLTQCKYTLGLINFLRGGNCDIKTFKEILKSSEFEDISEFTQHIGDIENPNLDGYNLKMQSDSADTFFKDKVPIQSFDKKYTIRDAVATRNDLVYEGSETNDIRLVNDENSFYVFNKSFLNKDNNWTFLCYNLVDMSSGNGDIKIDSKFSPLLPANLSQAVLEYFQYDINCSCKAFSSDAATALRFLIYYGVLDPEGIRWVNSSDKAWAKSGPIPGDAFSLRWDGEYGIKERVLKEYLEWQLNISKDCIAIIQWPMRLLADFDFSKKYRNYAIDYLVKNIKFDLDYKYHYTKFNETELAKV